MLPIRDLMTELGLTWTQIARWAHVSTTTLRLYETGAHCREDVTQRVSYVHGLMSELAKRLHQLPKQARHASQRVDP